MQAEDMSPEKYLLVEKVYRKNPWVKLLFPVLFFLGGCLCIFGSISGELEDEILKYGLFIMGIMVIFIGVCWLVLLRKWAITINPEGIIEYRISSKSKKFLHPILPIQIKWKDIIALYWIKTKIGKFHYSCFMIIPKSNDEVINSGVKKNKNGEVTKKYIEWLVLNDKTILFDKTVENYRDLINKICQTVPHIVIDEETRKLTIEVPR